MGLDLPSPVSWLPLLPPCWVAIKTTGIPHDHSIHHKALGRAICKATYWHFENHQKLNLPPTRSNACFANQVLLPALMDASMVLVLFFLLGLNCYHHKAILAICSQLMSGKSLLSQHTDLEGHFVILERHFFANPRTPFQAILIPHKL